MNPNKSDGQVSRHKAEMQRKEHTKVQKERLKEFKESRDPIFDAMYISMEKTRKWVTFFGVIVLLSLIVTVLFFLGI